MRKERDRGPDVRLPSALLERLEEHPSFARGLALGMLVGAAIAGSTIWSRSRGSAGGDPTHAAREGAPGNRD